MPLRLEATAQQQATLPRRVQFPVDNAWRTLLEGDETKSYPTELVKEWSTVSTNGNNATTLRRQAELWTEHGALPDIWTTQEHRCKPSTEQAWQKALRKLGSGGVAVHCKAHFGKHHPEFEALRGRLATNAERLAELTELTALPRTLQGAVVLAGDWNCEVTELDQFQFLQANRLQADADMTISLIVRVKPWQFPVCQDRPGPPHWRSTAQLGSNGFRVRCVRCTICTGSKKHRLA
eukprot:4528272-Amphidinium_carterae.3